MNEWPTRVRTGTPPCSRITSGTAREQIRLYRIVRARARRPGCRRRGWPWWSSRTGRGRSRRRRTRGRRRRRRPGRRRRPTATTRAWRSRWLAGWIGSAGWFGNVPSSSPYMTSRSKGSRSNTLGTMRPPMPLAVSATTFSGLEQRPVDERHDVVGERRRAGRSVLRRPARRRPAAGRAGEDGFGHGLDLGQAGVDADGLGPGEAQLDAVVLGRVVRRREHGAGRVEAPGGEVHEVGRHQTEVDDVDALAPHAVGERGHERRRRTAACRGRSGSAAAPAKRANASADGAAHAPRRAGRGRCRGCRRP